MGYKNKRYDIKTFVIFKLYFGFGNHRYHEKTLHLITHFIIVDFIYLVISILCMFENIFDVKYKKYGGKHL